MMNDREFVELKKLIIYVSDYYGRELKPETITMMANDLREFSLEEVRKAYEKFRKEDKLFKFPMPAQIISIIRPLPSGEDQAKEIAARITHAVSKYGYPNGKEARIYIGEIGWKIVERKGGWNYICQNLGTHALNAGTFEAQVREQAKMELVKHNNPRFGKLLNQLASGNSLENAISTKERLMIGGSGEKDK